MSYHLHRLSREEKISSSQAGREVVWFASGCGLCPVLRRAVPAMRRAGVAPLALALTDEPIPLPIIAQDAGLSVGEARWGIQVLKEVGIAQTAWNGKPSLAAGADECVARSLAHEPCPLWGSCAPSRALEGASAIRARRPSSIP